MRVRVTIEYDYEGEHTEADEAQNAEYEAWLNGDVDVQDITAAGGLKESFKVEII